MFTTTMIALVLAAGTPGAAKLPVDAIASVTSSAAQSGGTPKRTVKPTQYCVEEVITGSRMPRRVCNTRAQWLDQGFDPLAKK